MAWRLTRTAISRAIRVITVYLIRLALEGWKRLRLSQAMLTERGASEEMAVLLDRARQSREVDLAVVVDSDHPDRRLSLASLLPRRARP
ncbi:MAG: hypothetical protein M0Z95_10705 [Actinomycetota bacterium]|nr:hypothetical protein [Actinomycetota bacterium]